MELAAHSRKIVSAAAGTQLSGMGSSQCLKPGDVTAGVDGVAVAREISKAATSGAKRTRCSRKMKNDEKDEKASACTLFEEHGRSCNETSEGDFYALHHTCDGPHVEGPCNQVHKSKHHT